MKYLWWKEVVLGPFNENEIKNLNYSSIEKFINVNKDKLPKTIAFTENMINHPNVPHIIEKK